MQEHDARTLRGAAIPTALVGMIALIVGLAVSGGQGLLGALFGALLVMGAFASSAFAISWTGGRRPDLLLPAAFLVYTTKFGILMAVLLLFRGTQAMDTQVFGWTALTCVIVWLAAQAATIKRSKQPTIVPASEENEAEGSEVHR